MPRASVRVRLFLVALLALLTWSQSMLEAAGQALVSRNDRAAFSISLAPAAPAPIQVGTQLGFRLSLSTAGYASLYLIDPVGQVSVLAENLPLAAGSLEYPSSAQWFTLTARPPVGINRVVLPVTWQPFDGFSGDATLTSAGSLALRGDEFLPLLNRATTGLPRMSWATDEIRVRVVS